MENTVGVALTKCFFCGEDNEIILNTRLSSRMAKKVEAMHGKVLNKRPCSKCEKLMQQGIMFISVRDGETDKETNNNPYRTGKICVIKDEAVQRMGITPKELLNDILKKRMCFIEDTVWKNLGLPIENMN